GMDEVSIYGRALSDTEMRSIYRLGAGGKCKDGLPPEIISQPEDRVVGHGGETHFEGGVTGSRPLSFPWVFAGDPLREGTNAVLVLSNVLPAQAGAYSVIVSNASGTATSSNAHLTVKPPPTVVRAGFSTAAPGSKATVPFTLVTQGSEHSLAFSLAF